MPLLRKIGESLKSVLFGNILLLFITWILLTFGGSLTQNFSSLYFKQLGANDEIVGYISSISFATMAALQLIGGALADSIGRKKMIATFTFIFSFSILIFAFAPDWRYIVLATVISNLSLLYQPALFSVMMDSLPTNRRTFGFAITNLPQMVAIFAPPVGGYIVYRLGIIPGMRLNYFLFFLLAFSAAILRLKIKETLPHPKRKFRIKEVLQASFGAWKSVGRGMYYILYANITLNFVNGLTMAFLVLYATLYVSTVSWGIAVAVVIATQAILGLFVGHLADRGYKREFYITGLALLALANIIFIFPSLYFLFLFAIIRGLGIAFLSSPQNSLIADFVPMEMRGRIMGSYLFLSYLGGMVGASLAGHIYQAVHFLPFLLASWILAILSIAMYYLFRKYRGLSTPILDM